MTELYAPQADDTRRSMAAALKEGGHQPMIRMIRCRNTHRYFRPGGWTEKAEDAATFANEIEAVRACVEHGLNDIELVLRAPGSQCDLFSTPIR